MREKAHKRPRGEGMDETCEVREESKSMLPGSKRPSGPKSEVEKARSGFKFERSNN